MSIYIYTYNTHTHYTHTHHTHTYVHTHTHTHTHTYNQHLCLTLLLHARATILTLTLEHGLGHVYREHHAWERSRFPNVSKVSKVSVRVLVFFCFNFVLVDIESMMHVGRNSEISVS